MRKRLPIFILVFLCIGSAKAVGQTSRSSWFISNVTVTYGGFGWTGIGGSARDFQSLFPESTILNDSLQDSYAYLRLTPSSRNQKISCLVDIEMPKSRRDSSGAWNLRVGATFLTGAILNNTLSTVNVKATDSATFSFGQSIYFDSLERRKIDMNYRTQAANARLGLVYRITGKNLALVVGGEVNLGYYIERKIDARLLSTFGYQLRSDSGEAPFEQWLPEDEEVLRVSESKVYDRNLLASANLIFGAEIAGISDEDRMEHLRFTLTLMPGVLYNPIPELEKKHVYGFSASVGLAYAFK